MISIFLSSKINSDMYLPRYRNKAAGLVPLQSAHYFPIKLKWYPNLINMTE